jgi:hypothetical protein
MLGMGDIGTDCQFHHRISEGERLPSGTGSERDLLALMQELLQVPPHPGTGHKTQRANVQAIVQCNGAPATMRRLRVSESSCSGRRRREADMAADTVGNVARNGE